MNGPTPQREPLIAVRNVGVSYWRKKPGARKSPFWALRDVSLIVYHGETLGVIGRNGAGKSTLLRLLGGVIEPDRGTIQMGDCRAALLSLEVGFAGYLTGRENAYLSGMILGLTRKQIAARMNEIIEFSGLQDFIDQPLATYSSGMRARLGFAVGFQIDPDVMLIDEVYGVGDAEFREKSSAAIREKIKSNKTVVLVSHSEETIRDLCDRAVWIESGETRFEGDVDGAIQAYNESAR